ncbi:response regulator receiver domain [Pontivivens nitratireducens]|uniref:response regulator receiver domain n=1 Tax=Pontivivens nitratireducens TaxID=2758038 RepID=UPI00163AF924|nr:response regulator receiver domain [Pontibrevibacter nitratireducens]
MNFADDQYNAASSFAYTMIVVDDEPVDDPVEPEPALEVKTPGRRDVAAAKKVDQKPEAQRSHPLDAKGLIKSALDLGLVCSVVNPTGDEGSVAKSVAKASLRADIVSLDWHMNHGDDGELASEIIQEILRGDEAIGGRLRLIAIYTGNKDQGAILEKIAERLNAAEEIAGNVTKTGDVLTNSSGLRIIWREKSMGNEKLANAVSETQLPKELLKAFSELSNGLLSNVALATISSMRDTTHHVLSKFSSELDGPFFHHRALLKNSSDSMDYAVSVVMSALKSEVDKSKVTSKYTTVDAIKRRLSQMPQSPENFTLRYSKKDQEKEFKLHIDDVISIMERGFSAWPDKDRQAAVGRQQDKQASPMPPKDAFSKSFSTLFCDTIETASFSMRQFSFLTNSQSSELSMVHRKAPPKLGLGSVIFSDADGGYFLCLQATCDTVRGAGLFFFVPLEVVDSDTPDIVVPHGRNGALINYVGLSVPPKCYTKSLSLDFGVINDAIGHIPICYDEQREIYHVPDANNTDYRWLANLKYKRALRIAQNMSQEISRIGFDEFEPFRKG